MNELFRKLTKEVQEEMSKILGSPEIKTLIDATKAASDTGSFEVVISTADIDRQGESINQAGWDLTKYLLNPVVLWGHDYYSLPIGITDEITISEGKLVARGRFAPEEANPFAQQVRRLYDLKIVRATSVGFIGEAENGVIANAELLEFSFVPVPANPYALSLAKAQEMRLDLAMIATKGLKLETKEDEKITVHVAAEGDECEMPDGTMGEMHPNDAGEMVCMPKKSKASTKPTICEPDSPDYDPQACGAIFCDPESPDFNQDYCDLMKTFEAKPEEEKAVVAYYRKAERKEKDAQQIGAILAQLQNIVSNAIVMASRLILDIVQTEYAQSVVGKGEIAAAMKADTTIQAIKKEIADLEQKLRIPEGEERSGGSAPQQRSGDGEAVSVSLKELNDFLMARELLASVNRATNSALERINSKIREGRKVRG